ncbi:MAG TPA: DUF5916 domain-containing protein [Pyrinomonadaceae bacterium]|jgi:hypothetical protein
MKTRLLLATALPGAVFQASSRTTHAAGVVHSNARRAALALLALASLLYGAGAQAQNLQPRQTRRLAQPRSTEVAGGSRVTIVSDSSLDDYTAYREAGRFNVLIPQAQLTSAINNLTGRGFTDFKVEQQGGDVKLSFALEPAATASVSQKFNRLDVVFSVKSESAAAGVAEAAMRAAAQTSAGKSDELPVAEKVSLKPTPDPTPEATPAPAKNETADSSAKAATADATGKTGAVGTRVPPEKASPIQIAKFEKAPVIDGKLDDEVWKTAAVFKDFLQFRPGDNVAPSQPTEVMMGYDAKFLYIAFRAHDEPGKVRATVPKRDQVFDDDTVGMYLDTFNDRRRAYVLVFNPLGVQADGIFTEGSGEDYSVDIVMESKGEITEAGYTVEVAIPFKSLRYEAGKDKQWGIHFLRQIKRQNNETDSWMPIRRDVSSTLSQAGHITGLEGVSTERTLELIPSLTISETGRNVGHFPGALPDGALEAGRMVNEPVKLDPGLTMKYGITPTVTLDLALNPDFAQVEADQTVVTANQRFPIFFAEKRPFFLEGIDIFKTPLQVVHTRAIVDPDVAVKLSGKRGKTSFGLMAASDNGPGNLSADDRGRISSCHEARLLGVPGDPDNCANERFLDKNAYIGVLRLKRDVGQENSLGMIATSYNFIEKHNQLLGVDGRFRFNKQSVGGFEFYGTTSRNFFFEPDQGESIYRTGNAFAYHLRFDDDGRNFGWNYDGQGFTRDYRADVGFTRRTNTNRHGVFLYYNTDPKEKAKLVRQHYHILPEINFDWQGRIQSWGHEMQTEWGFQRQTFAGLGVSFNFERIFEEEFGPTRQVDEGRCFSAAQLALNPGLRCGFAGDDSERSTMRNNVYGYFGSTPAKKYSVFIFMIHNWGAFDFDFGAGSKFPRVSPAALVRQPCLDSGTNPDDCAGAPQDPGRGNQLRVESNFTYQPTNALRISLDYVKDRLVRRDTGLVAYDDNIYTLRGTYQFTRFTFARARVDYDSLASSVRGQFLLGWTPNPGTSFYVGYNDDLNYNGFGPFTGRLEPGFRRNGRTFFIKMSYLIRRSF